NVPTPHVDRLVAEGVACTQAVSQYPICVPYRASLVTGAFSPRNGTVRHGDYLPPGTPTVAHAFAAAGYRTSYVGKWHLQPETGAAFVTPGGFIGQGYWVHPDFRGGFQEWCGFNVSNDYFSTYVAAGEQVKPEKLEGHQTDALTDRTLEMLARQPADAPWFHVLAYEAPHPGGGGHPRSPGYPVPDAYEDLVDPAALTLRPNVPPEHADVARVQLAGYYRMIRHLDDNVGRVLDFLDTSGLAERTLVVFLADHGEMGGSHGLRHKHVPYAESVHVPLVWRWPGVLPAGARYGGPICGVDVYPTSAGLAGVPVPEPVAGLDHGGVLRQLAAGAPGGGAAAPGDGGVGRGDGGPARGEGGALPDGAFLRDAVLLQWEAPRFAFGDHPYRGVRTARYTYTVGRDAPFCLLFDRDADPYEQHDRFADPVAQDVRRALHARLEALLLEHEGALPDYVVVGRPTGA
ncbi:MAG: sulfatase-like hydrolase/transferase, partial [Trueperaceae bacterium]|nr:sulfatase-like hydrolase/transferase [Trueperaceae bacterium]